MLCSLEVKNWIRIPLPGRAKKGLRNMLLASVDFGGRNVQVLITHVDRFTDRKNQLRIIIAMFLSLNEPAILMGDLNSNADDEQLRALLATKGVRDVTNGHGGVDWIITRGLRTIRAGIHETDASDHPMIWAQLRLDK
jgi:endonuclease/exonuclease/phosphatase family metal-dependent hydrolase